VPQRYHVGYAIQPSSPRPHWTPTSVVFDGQRTYVLFPRNLEVMNAPLMRMIGPSGPEVVNAHQHGPVIWVDALVDRAELRIGSGTQAETVTLTREALRLIDCPGNPQCPAFPQEVSHVRP